MHEKNHGYKYSSKRKKIFQQGLKGLTNFDFYYQKGAI